MTCIVSSAGNSKSFIQKISKHFIFCKFVTFILLFLLQSLILIFRIVIYIRDCECFYNYGYACQKLCNCKNLGVLKNVCTHQHS